MCHAIARVVTRCITIRAINLMQGILVFQTRNNGLPSRGVNSVDIHVVHAL